MLFEDLPEDELRLILQLVLQLEREATGSTVSQVGIACRRLWALYCQMRFAGGRQMVVDNNQAQPIDDTYGNAIAAFAPGVSDVCIRGQPDVDMLSSLGTRAQQVTLVDQLENNHLLQQLSTWPQLRQLKIHQLVLPGGWQQFALSGGLPNPLPGKVVELMTMTVGVAAMLPQLTRLTRLCALRDDIDWDLPAASLPAPDAAHLLPLLTALKEVELSGPSGWLNNNLEMTNLIAVLASLPSLQRCDIRPLELTTITTSLAQLSSLLTSLEVEALEELPAITLMANVWRLTALERLQLTSCGRGAWRSAFPAEPRMCALRVLRLSSCFFLEDTLPAQLFNGDVLPALQELYVHCSKDVALNGAEDLMAELPPCFSSLTTLTHLEMHYCALLEVPAPIQQLQLRRLSLVGNPIEELPEGPWLQSLTCLNI